MKHEFPTYPKIPEKDVPNAYMLVDKSDWSREDHERHKAKLKEQDRQAKEQTAAEQTYTFETPY